MSEYRVDDDWIDREDDSDYVLRTAINVQNLFATLKELKTRRESDTSGGVKMERVSDEWLEKEISVYKDWETKENGFSTVRVALEELQSRRKAEKEHGHTDNSASEKDGAVLPIPCTKGYEDWTVKQWFAKINEELDELKEIAINGFAGLNSHPNVSYVFDGSKTRIAEEAADAITSITSMLEAMGIDEHQRQASQKLVNEHNRQRGRL